MERIPFECKSCGKKIELTKEIFERAYEGRRYCLSCRNQEGNEEKPIISVREYKHGGVREGAGRPSKGVRRTIGITLPEEEWAKIDGLFSADQKLTQAEYFRRLHNFFMRNKDEWWKLWGLEHYE